MAKHTYIIGRAGDISLYDDTVSRRHACLEIEGDSLVLRDLDSRNGTYELREKRLVPFTAGPVTRDQVFAFGECVRSVMQLLAEIEGGGESLADTAGGEHAAAAPDPLDVTHLSVNVEPRQRLTTQDIVALLERVEDEVATGKDVDTVCATLGITAKRYERWCREHGATRATRGGAHALGELRRENERLLRLVADLSLECSALKDALRAANDAPRDEAAAAAPAAPAVSSPATPSLTVVRDKKS